MKPGRGVLQKAPQELGYEELLATLPRRHVSLGEFEQAAVMEGWSRRSIDLLLLAPSPRYPIKVGLEVLVIR